MAESNRNRTALIPRQLMFPKLQYSIFMQKTHYFYTCILLASFATTTKKRGGEAEGAHIVNVKASNTALKSKKEKRHFNREKAFLKIMTSKYEHGKNIALTKVTCTNH